MKIRQPRESTHGKKAIKKANRVLSLQITTKNILVYALNLKAPQIITRLVKLKEKWKKKNGARKMDIDF